MPCRCMPAIDISLYRNATSSEGKQAQAYFEKKGVAFADNDISTNPSALKKIEELSGQIEQVVIVVNQQVFVGFKPDELDLAVPSLFDWD
jgi:arsenate reductase-like glutaredoxin family protein